MTEQKGPCPDHQIDTNGSDSYCWNDSKGVGNCLSCGLATWLDDKGRLWAKKTKGSKPYLIEGEGHLKAPFSKQEDAFSNTFNEEYEVLDNTEQEGTYKPMRGITEDTMEMFGVVTYGDTQEYVYPTGGIKVRKLPKDFHAKNGFKGDELFGMNLFPAGCSKVVVCTEGELDALSAWQMLKNGSFINPVVSFPSASPSGKLWEKCKKYLDSFDKIVLSVDNDEAGQKLQAKVSEIFPDKTYIMNHGDLKDANDFLQAGMAKEYKSAWWGAKKFKPDSILSDSDDYLKLYEDSPDFEYFTTGIEQLDEKMLGISKGYVTLVQAETGLGKTEFCRYLENRALNHSDYKIAAMHLEESKLRSLLGLVSYKLGENVTIKKFIEEKGLDEEVRGAITEISESERFVTFDFDMQEGHEELIKQVRYLVAAMSVDFIFIEPIQDCVTGSSSEKEGKLADLITQLSTLASKLNVGIVVVAHQNADGGSMYSSMITKRAAFELLLKRDRDSDDVVEKNRTHVVIGRKNRTGLGNGSAGSLDFDLESYTLKPVEPTKAPVVNRKDDF